MNAHLTETYAEGLLVGYRYFERRQIPVQFCFGHGLSYTTFACTDLEITENGSPDAPVCMSLSVENTGDRTGMETVQVYVGRPDAGPWEPVKALWGFQKLSLKPGEKKRVEIPLPARAFQSWHTDAGAFVTDAGNYEIYAGSSLMDIRLKGRVNITKQTG
jgi:beta-glucosidase